MGGLGRQDIRLAVRCEFVWEESLYERSESVTAGAEKMGEREAKGDTPSVSRPLR